MPSTIKTKLSIIFYEIKIDMLRHRIKKMEHLPYLDLSERIELRDTYALLQRLEQQQQELHHAGMLSLH